MSEGPVQITFNVGGLAVPEAFATAVRSHDARAAARTARRAADVLAEREQRMSTRIDHPATRHYRSYTAHMVGHRLTPSIRLPHLDRRA